MLPSIGVSKICLLKVGQHFLSSASSLSSSWSSSWSSSCLFPSSSSQVVRENAADDDEWGEGANAGSSGAGLGATPDDDDEKWD